MSRHVYLDESGTGNIDKEPHVVVAGIIIDPDRDWKRVETRLADLASAYAIRASGDKPIIFHANAIFHGHGYWPRDRYSQETRMALLRDLCGIPALFDLPLVTGFVDRRSVMARLAADTPPMQTLAALVSSAVRCTIGVERYMRQHARDEEVATLIYENNDLSKKLIREIHEALKRRPFSEEVPFDGWPLKKFLPIERIVDTAYFAEKAETSILQVADACVFAIRRQLCGKSGGKDLVDLFRSQLTTTIT